MVGPGGDYMKKFLDRYQCEFGFTIPDKIIIVDDIRVRGIGRNACVIETEKNSVSGDVVPEQVFIKWSLKNYN